jgi:MSHA biogenesis protein MshI
MSLLAKISNLFSKKQSEQLVGIALQQKSLGLCIIPPVAKVLSADMESAEETIFKKRNVDSSDFASVMDKLKNEYDFNYRCHLVLNSSQSQIVQVDKPKVPKEEIISALKWQIKDLVSISPENMVLDYFDTPLMAGGIEKINVVCSPLNELKKLVAVLNTDSAKVASITIEEFAFANLQPIQNDACLLVCQQPNEEIILLIVKQGKLYFQRRLNGFSQIASKTEDELSMTVIDSLALEIQRSSDYFERQLRQAPIKEIKVLLPMNLESFFARKLAENSHLPVSLLALPEAYQTHREYAAAIGATMTEARTAEQTQEFAHVS